MNSEKLTKDDVRKIEEEIKHRKLVVKPKALDDLRTARAHGDLSENFEYYAAKKFNRENNSRIDYLEKMLRNATIIEVNIESGVRLNSLVKVVFIEDGVETDNVQTYKIVTSIRGDSLKNKISIESPLGKALVGANVDDIVNVHLPNGVSYDVKIIEIQASTSDDDDIISY